MSVRENEKAQPEMLDGVHKNVQTQFPRTLLEHRDAYFFDTFCMSFFFFL